jgi:hypothetical protein
MRSCNEKARGESDGRVGANWFGKPQEPPPRTAKPCRDRRPPGLTLDSHPKASIAGFTRKWQPAGITMSHRIGMVAGVSSPMGSVRRLCDRRPRRRLSSPWARHQGPRPMPPCRAAIGQSSWWKDVGDQRALQFWNLASDCFEWLGECCGGPSIGCGAVASARTGRGIAGFSVGQGWCGPATRSARRHCSSQRAVMSMDEVPGGSRQAMHRRGV